MGQLFGVLVSILAGGFLIRFLIIGWIWMTIHDFGRDHGWWGTSLEAVEIVDFQFHESNDYSAFMPHVSGVLQNNSDNPLTKFYISVDYYRCAIQFTNIPESTVPKVCNQVFPANSIPDNTYEIKMGIPPHTSAHFRINHSVFEHTNVVSQYSESGYFVRVIPRITDTW